MRGANRSISLVVDDEKLDRQPQPGNRRQFLNIHLETPVAVNADSAPLAGDGRSDGRRQAESHSASATIVKTALPSLGFEHKQENFRRNACAGAGDDILAR